MSHWEDFSLKRVIWYFGSYVIPHKISIVAVGLWLNYHWYSTNNPFRDQLHLSLWRLLIHDKSKFRADEFIPYSNFFCGENKENDIVQKKFRNAVEMHYSRNSHHPEYYKNNDYKMPIIDLSELLCDWFAASLGYKRIWPKPGEWDWIKNSWNKLNLHEENKILLAEMLTELGYRQEVGKLSTIQHAKASLNAEDFKIFEYFHNKNSN